MNIRHNYAGPEMEFARSVKAAVLGAVAVGILLIAAGTPDGAGVVTEATAAAQPADGDRHAYFPAGFGPVQGEIERPIEQF